MEENKTPINDFPAEIILDLHTKFTPEMYVERAGYLDAYVAANESRMSSDFLDKQVNGHKALIYYQGKQYAEAITYYVMAAEKSTPADLLFFHEHCMVARCYRLLKEYEKSEEWIQKAYASKHLMSNAFELLDLLMDYTDLLVETERTLDGSFLPDLRWIIMETGMEVRLNETNLNEVVQEMRELNRQENIRFSNIVLLLKKDKTEGIKQLNDFIGTSRIRYYKQEAAAYLQSLQQK